jgi:bifunctional non-homologous end joining protein LigD
LQDNTYTESRQGICQALCAQMAADSPYRYVINMIKKLRGGKILLDYLRNDQMSTAVVPWSPGAPVSMPISWSQVRSGLHPSRFTVRTAPKLIHRSRAWSDYCESERSLKKAIRRVSRAAAA